MVGLSRPLGYLPSSCCCVSHFLHLSLLDYPDPDNFTWEKYLKETGASAVPAWAFKVVSATSSSSLYVGRNSNFLYCQVFKFMKSKEMFSIFLPQAWDSDVCSRFRSEGCPRQIDQNGKKSEEWPSPLLDRSCVMENHLNLLDSYLHFFQQQLCPAKCSCVIKSLNDS